MADISLTSAPESQRADAVRIPLNWKPSTGDYLAIGLWLARKMSELLQCDKSNGETAHVRQQVDHWFATRHIHDTIFFPNTHHRARQPRYRWVKQDDGVELGYLVAGATEGGEVDA